MSQTPYDREFYKAQRAGSRGSARVVVPLVIDLVKPTRVADVGCGVGTWLSVFKECGVQDVLGIDGPYIAAEDLEFPKVQFLAWDLGKPLRTERRFDLALCLEVAEHLPIECAETLIDTICHLAPVVLFSAAIPLQGGVNHLNEQWPEYWAELFRKHEFVAIDCLREKIWQNPEVVWWYAQNTLLFAQRSALEDNPRLKAEFQRTGARQLSIVHPTPYLGSQRAGMGFRDALTLVVYLAWKAVAKRVNSILR